MLALSKATNFSDTQRFFMFFELYIIYRLDNHPKAQPSCLKHCNWIVVLLPAPSKAKVRLPLAGTVTLLGHLVTYVVGGHCEQNLFKKLAAHPVFGSWLNKACDIWHGTAGYLMSWFSCDRNQSLVKMFQSTRIVPQKGPFCSPLFPLRFCIDRDT